MTELIQHGGQLEIEFEDKSRLAKMLKVYIDSSKNLTQVYFQAETLKQEQKWSTQ